MKKTWVLFLLAICSIGSYGQDSTAKPKKVLNRNMGFEFSAGYSVPLGTYASADRQDKKSGYATGGWQAQLTFDWLGNRGFGLAIQYTYQRNPMKSASNLVYPYPGQIPDNHNAVWSNHYLLLGPVFMKTIKRVAVDAKMLGGAIVSSSENFDTPNPSDTTGLSANSNIATGFGYQVSVGIGYAISSHFALKFNLALMGGWPGKSRQYGSQLIGYEAYKDPITGIEYVVPIYSAPIDYDIQKIVTTLNPSFGLIYRF